MKTYTINVAESFIEVAEAWNRGESINYPEGSFITPVDEQQAVADAIAEGKQSHDDLRSLIQALKAIDDNGAPPAIRAAAELIKGMWETAQNNELASDKRKALVWAEIHPKRNTQDTELRDRYLRRVVDYLVGEDICESRPNGWTLENLADTDSPLFGVVTADAIQKIRRRTKKPVIETRNERQLDIDIDMLKRIQEKLSKGRD